MKPALAVLGTYRFPLDRVAEVLPHLRQLVADTNAHDGCLMYEIAQDISDPGLFRLSELWPDPANLERHMTAPHVMKWRAACQACGILDKQFTICEVSGTRGL